MATAARTWAPRAVHRGVALGLCVLLAGGTAIVVAQSIRATATALTHPYSLSYTGGLVAYWIDHPTAMYGPLDTEPYLPAIYPPMYALFAAALDRVLGSLAGPFVAARLLSRLASLATAGLLYHTIHRASGHRPAAIIAAALFALSPAVTGETVFLRVDHLALAFTVAGLWWYLHGPAHTNRVIAAGVLCVLAGFTKPTAAVILGAALAGDLALDRDWRRCRLLVGVVGVMTGLGWVSLWLATDGRAWTQLVTLNAGNPIYVHQILAQSSWAGYQHAPLAILAGVALLGATRVPRVIALFTAVGLAVGAITVGKEGAWIGYFYPAIAGMALLAGSQLAAWLPAGRWRVDRGAGRTVLVLLALSLLLAQAGLYADWTPSSPYDSGAQSDLAERVAAVDGPVLSEDASLVVATATPGVYDPLMHRSVGEAWHSPVADRLRAGDYALVITRVNMASDGAYENGRWSEAEVRAVRTAYEEVDRAGGYRVYSPVR